MMKAPYLHSMMRLKIAVIRAWRSFIKETLQIVKKLRA